MGFAEPSSPSLHTINLGLKGVQGRWLPMRSHLAKRQSFSFRTKDDEGQEIRVPFIEL